MKTFKFVLCFVAVTILSSCIDSEEKIVLNADNSGIYSMTLDMGKVLEMAAGFGAKNEGDKPKEKKDTTVYLKDFMSDADSLTAEEKALYSQGVLSFKIDEENNEMKIMASCPFKDAAGLTAVKNNLFKIVQKLKAFETATGEKPKTGDEEDLKMGMKSTNPVEDYFKFFAAPGKISNTVINIDTLKNKIASDSSLTMMNQMAGMMGEVKYRTIIVLPKNVKKYEGPGSKVSADKRTITFESTLTDLMEHPEKISYIVEY